MAISERRVREAAEDLVQWRYGAGTKQTATEAGEDMRDWQMSGVRVSRMSAAQKALQKTKAQPTNKKRSNIQSQLSAAMYGRR